jgi:hypothetical protein
MACEANNELISSGGSEETGGIELLLVKNLISADSSTAKCMCVGDSSGTASIPSSTCSSSNGCSSYRSECTWASDGGSGVSTGVGAGMGAGSTCMGSAGAGGVASMADSVVGLGVSGWSGWR